MWGFLCTTRAPVVIHGVVIIDADQDEGWTHEVDGLLLYKEVTSVVGISGMM